MYITYNEITIFIFCSLFILAFLISQTAKYDSKKIDFFFVFCLVMIFSFVILYRNGFGVDEPFYLLKYDYFFESEFNLGWGFYGIFYLLRFLGVASENFNNVMVFLYLIASTLFVIGFIKTNDKAVCLLFLLFTYVSIDFSFNVYRQGLAVVFLLITIFSFNNKNYLLACFFALFTLSLHWTSPLILAAFFVSNFFSLKKYRLILAVILVLTSFSFLVPPRILPVIMGLISNLPFEADFITNASYYYEISSYSGNTIYDMSYWGRVPLFYIISGFILSSLFLFRSNSFIVLLLLYSLIFIDMPYSFRNYYWVLSLYPLLIYYFMVDGGYTKRQNRYNIILTYYCLVQLPIFLSSGIVPLIFLN